MICGTWAWAAKTKPASAITLPSHGVVFMMDVRAVYDWKASAILGGVQNEIRAEIRWITRVLQPEGLRRVCCRRRIAIGRDIHDRHGVAERPRDGGRGLQSSGAKPVDAHICVRVGDANGLQVVDALEGTARADYVIADS